jgi:hypothetical protein
LITRIHIDRNIILANKKREEQGLQALPPLSVKIRGKTYKTFKVHGDGPFEVVYNPEKPLGCGARSWVETTGNVEFIGITHDEIKTLLAPYPREPYLDALIEESTLLTT